MSFPISAGLLDACVLAALRRGDTYGYVLTQQLKSAMDISESTLYPVLRRLQKEGLLTTYDQPFAGRNRRYYAITPKGAAILAGYLEEWFSYKNRLEQILIPGGEEN